MLASLTYVSWANTERETSFRRHTLIENKKHWISWYDNEIRELTKSRRSLAEFPRDFLMFGVYFAGFGVKIPGIPSLLSAATPVAR